MINSLKKHSYLSLIVLFVISAAVVRFTTAGTDTVAVRYNAASKLCAQYVDMSQLYVTGTAATTIKSQAAAAATTASPTFTGTVTIPTPFTLGAISVLSTGTELNYVDGVTSAIQTQINAKSPIASPTFTGTVDIPTPFSINSVSMTSTATELNLLDTAVAGTVVASKAVVVGANKELDTLVIADSGLKLGAGAGTAVTSTAAELNILDGVTATTAILNLTLTGSATTRAAVRADGGDAAPLASQYNSTAGKMYFKVANATADTDWELVTTTASD